MEEEGEGMERRQGGRAGMTERWKIGQGGRERWGREGSGGRVHGEDGGGIRCPSDSSCSHTCVRKREYDTLREDISSSPKETARDANSGHQARVPTPPE